MITPLASVLVNRLTGSRTIITRKMQTPPSLTYDQKLKLDDLAQRLIASEEPVTLLIDGHEAEISEYLIKKLPAARVVMDGGSLRASNIKLAAWTDYFVVSEHFARDYMSYRALSTEKEIKTALLELNKIWRGFYYSWRKRLCLFKERDAAYCSRLAMSGRRYDRRRRCFSWCFHLRRSLFMAYR